MRTTHYEQVGVAMTCRGFEEYRLMFGLTAGDLAAGPILDVAAGGSSFTAECRSRGLEADAVDPRYGGEIAAWIAEAKEEIASSTAKLELLKDKFDWSYYGSLEQHRRGREASLLKFETHVSSDEGAACYKSGSLPALPMEDNSYSLVLCSHFLFLYAEQFGYEFHLNALRELIRVCRPGGQIRIYPLLSLRWEPYPQLDELLEAIRASGCEAELRMSGLPFIPGSAYNLHITVADKIS